MVSQPASHSCCVLPQALYACRIDVKHAVQHQNCLTLGTGRTMRGPDPINGTGK